jgi:hypothetical protein
MVEESMRYPNVVPHHLAVGSHPSAVGRQVRNLPAIVHEVLDLHPGL